MTIEQVGIFRLIDPPPGQADVIRAAVAAIDFPWERLQAALDKDSDKCVLVRWLDTGQGVSGLFWRHNYEIHLTTREAYLNERMGFVFAHEVGHLVDAAGLNDEARAALMDEMHEGPYRQLGHFNHDHPDAGHLHEEWTSGEDPYVSRIYESYADQFVAAFAPSLWEGHYPRFVHWTDNHQAIRDLTLYPLPEPEVKAASVEKRPRRRLRRGWRRRVRRLVRRVLARVRRRRSRR